MSSRAEKGSASILVAAVIGLAAVLGAVVGDIGLYLHGRARAMAAADAAALAAAPVTFHVFGTEASPEEEAALFAAANGAALVSCDCPVDRSWQPRVVTVVVTTGVELALLGHREVPATSRAEFDPTSLAMRSSPDAMSDRQAGS